MKLISSAERYFAAPSRFWSGKGFGGDAGMGTFAFPFVVFAEQGFVFFYLRFDFVESFLAARANMFAGCGGVESSRGKGEI